MMAQVNAGRVRFVGRGEYNNSTQYYVFDLVSYNGNSYYAKVDTIGHLPTDTTYWQLVAEKGNVGPIGLTGNGISSIEKTSTSGLVDTYTITFTNGNTTTFDVSNGNGIDRIEKTATVGNIDTYTIYFNDNSTSTFEVANGEVTREELEEEVDRLSMIYNAFPSTSNEGEEITLDGTAEVPFKKLNLKGNTSQFSTIGKNLLPNTATTITKNGITFTKNSDGTYTVSGTATANAIFSILVEGASTNPTLQAGTYTLSGCPSGGSVNTYKLDISVGSYNQDLGSGVTFTLSEATQINYVRILVYNGQTINTVFKPMIESGNTKTSFEPYTNGPAPNPSYPYPVNVVSGDNTIDICGKNIINIPNRTYTNSTISVVANDGVLTINGTNSTTGNIIVEFTGINNYTTNQNITMVRNGDDISDGNAQLFLTVDGTEYNMGNQTSHPDWRTLSYSGTITRLRLRIAPDASYTNFKIKPMLYLGDYDSSILFEPYKGASYPVNLGTMELCKIGDYQDYIRKSTGKNLFDKNSANILKANLNSATNISGNISNSNRLFYLPIKPNTTYTIQKLVSLYFVIGTAEVLPDYGVAYSQRIQDSTASNLTITTSSTAKYLVCWFWNSNDTLTEQQILDSIQVEENSQASPYEPYGKVWYIHKDIGKVVFNGSEAWGTMWNDSEKKLHAWEVSISDSMIYPDNLEVINPILCDNFKTYGQTPLYANQGAGKSGIAGRRTTNHIIIENNDITILTDFKTWLGTHNTIVYYALATPIITEITDTTLIEQLDNLENAYSYDTQTNISQTNADKPFILDVEAILSLKNILN